MKIYYLGPKGTYSEQALLIYIKNKKGYILKELSTIPDIIESLNYDSEAIVPIENSIEGSVNVTLDMLINDFEGIKIKGEIILPISHCLIGCETIDFNDIKSVVSHPQALAQCRKFIKNNIPNAKIISSNSTASAIKEIINKKGAVAICGENAAKLYGLKVISNNIQDFKENSTRFVILAYNDSNRTGNDKTSIVFSVKNKPGALNSILEVFTKENINMTKIESRPSKKILGEYVFWVDIEGHRCDNHLNIVLNRIKSKTVFLKVLGSYPKYEVKR